MKRGTFSVLVIAGTFLLDQLTKLVAHSLIDHEGVRDVLPVFQLVHFHNTGAAFGMGGMLGNNFFVIASLVAMAVIAYMIVRDIEDTLSLSLILGGATGNLADRIFVGSVRDFLDFHIGTHHWPAFNIADSALTVGVGIMIYKSLFAAKPTCTSTQDGR